MKAEKEPFVLVDVLTEHERYRKALQRIVDSGDNMAEGIYLGAASCYRIAKDALDNTNTFPEQT